VERLMRDVHLRLVIAILVRACGRTGSNLDETRELPGSPAAGGLSGNDGTTAGGAGTDAGSGTVGGPGMDRTLESRAARRTVALGDRHKVYVDDDPG
jgi:hypothetical protein